MSYPMFLYHADKPDGRLFYSFEEHKDLKGWHDTPAALEPDYVPPVKVERREGDGAIALANMGVVRVRYPAHFYRKGDPDNPITINSEEEELALDHDVWKDTWNPKAWDDSTPEPEPVPQSFSVFQGAGEAESFSAPKPAPVKVEPPPPPVRSLPDEARAALYKNTVDQLLPIIGDLGNVGQLRAILVAEHNNPKGERKMVVRAVQARLKELAVPDVVEAGRVNDAPEIPPPPAE